MGMRIEDCFQESFKRRFNEALIGIEKQRDSSKRKATLCSHYRRARAKGTLTRPLPLDWHDISKGIRGDTVSPSTRLAPGGTSETNTIKPESGKAIGIEYDLEDSAYAYKCVAGSVFASLARGGTVLQRGIPGFVETKRQD
jgi:hypothetical protein